jgi:hypothetical protein
MKTLRSLVGTTPTVLICMSPLPCNSISMATPFHNSTVSSVAMIRLSKQRATENGVFQLFDRGYAPDRARVWFVEGNADTATGDTTDSRQFERTT